MKTLSFFFCSRSDPSKPSSDCFFGCSDSTHFADILWYCTFSLFACISSSITSWISLSFFLSWLEVSRMGRSFNPSLLTLQICFLPANSNGENRIRKGNFCECRFNLKSPFSFHILRGGIQTRIFFREMSILYQLYQKTVGEKE